MVRSAFVLWHVDDLKIAQHVNHKGISSGLQQFIEAFRKEALLSRRCRKVHEYLGMTLEFSTPCKD